MQVAQTQQYLNTLYQKIRHPRIGTVLGLQEEVGELCKCIMEWEIYGSADPVHLGEECADVLFSLFDVCNGYNIDLEAASERKLEYLKSKIGDWEAKYEESLRMRREILDRS